MQEMDPSTQQTETERSSSSEPGARRRILRRRVVTGLALAAAVLLLLFLPPYISLNRYQRRIASSIGQSLGRPVHLDRVSLNLLPRPGFTLENFVVSEDPEFGYEPMIRANEVKARLRVSSLWRGRVEFSTISFTDPSMNLVRLPDGRWNVESLLLHASRVEVAPTAQKRPGPAPRFPYIEATGARLNFKQSDEKTPFSLNDAEFALWLPDPEHWRLRLLGHPTRTDTSVQYTGTMRLEATLGRAASLADFPLELNGAWRDAPLGEASRLVLGHDAGWRGTLTLETYTRGTLGENGVRTRLRINGARREAFIPEHPLNVDLTCRSVSKKFFRSFPDILCAWASDGGEKLLINNALNQIPPGTPFGDEPGIALRASIPDVGQWRAAQVETGIWMIPAATLIDWWHVLSPRVPEGLTADGSIAGSLAYDGTLPDRQWDGGFTVTGARLNPQDGVSLLAGGLALHTIKPPVPDKHHRAQQPPAGNHLQFDPLGLNLGGHEPATLTGQIDTAGSTFHLSGMATPARMAALAKAIPPLGDGLDAVLPRTTSAEPFRIDLTATRLWGQQQEWHDNLAHPAASAQHHHR